LFTQKLFKNKNIQESPESESYKLSFLFWLYALLNILLIFLWHRNKIWWLILLWGFILLLYFLLLDSAKDVKKSE
jgi:Flp pilus assembly protein TadB